MYKALYRKWRPLTFGDVISQSHITDTLKNQIKNEKTAHAYLFTGSRGTGKTTCARILAKAVNCLNPIDGEPCLECELCHDADNFALSDIIEIDAASNNSVDDIRTLREGAVYTPERGKYRVYIIDEVHMLSQSAFNALLKIMEEPPPYVKFILATTEIHKVPATITSRCQRFDFRRIKTEDIAKRLLYVANEEGIALTENAALMIAKLSDGGMRDALSLLDKCSSYAESIDENTVCAASGASGRDYLFGLVDAILKKEPAKAIEIISDLYSMSKDMQILCAELINEFRNIMLLKTDMRCLNLIVCMPDEEEKLKSYTEQFDMEKILFCLKSLQDCTERLTKAVDKRVEAEMCLITLCLGENNKIHSQSLDNCHIYDKINKSDVEDKRDIPDLTPIKSDAKPQNDVKEENQTQKQAVAPIQKQQLRAEDFKPFTRWAEVLEKFSKTNPAIVGTLKDSSALVNGNMLLITAVNSFFMTLFKVRENAEKLGEAIAEVTGNTYVIRARCVSDKQENQSNAAESLIKRAQSMDIDVVTDNH